VYKYRLRVRGISAHPLWQRDFFEVEMTLVCAFGTRVTWIRRTVPSWPSTCRWTAKEETNSISRMLVMISQSGADIWGQLYIGQNKDTICTRREYLMHDCRTVVCCAPPHFVIADEQHNRNHHSLPPL
jgi:hypothetical protein